MPVAKIVAGVVTLVFCVTTGGLAGGLYKAFKNNNTTNEKKIGISFCVFLCLTIIAYTIMGKIPVTAP